MRYLILGLFIISCSSIEPIQKKTEVLVPEETFSNVTSQINLQPGKVRFLEFETSLKDGRYSFNCDSRSIPFYVKDKVSKTYFIESYFSKLKIEKCFYDKKLVFTLHKKEFPYKKEKLNVDKRRVFLNKKDLDRVIKERAIKKKIYQNGQEYFLFDEAFRRPLNSYITSHYGNKRLFNNKKQTQHLGNDLRAAVGVEIPSANTGRVAFTGNLFYSGNIVVLDHGLDIFSIYGHLSKILVKEGDIVKKGDVVGLAGATGRVSGPHLHWGVKVQGQWVDGFSLVEESKKQFDDK